MKNFKKIIRTTIREILNEQESDNSSDTKLKCIQSVLKLELDKYNNENLDDRWTEIRQVLRSINGYFEDGYFLANRDDEEILLTDFLKNLNYSKNHTYRKGEKVGQLPNTNSNIPFYKAIGDKTLFRGVSLKDWNRIKNQGFIDTDMRGAIVDSEGINLGQIPDTASYYLPHNEEGVILAISPNNLDLYMLADEYIRVFEPIPLKNIIKVSDTIVKNKIGSILTKNTPKKISDIINKLKQLNININC